MSDIDSVRARADEARARGQEVVAVIGLGFVGTAVAANLARARGADGRPLFHVIGVERDDEAGRAKAAALARGEPPVYANDPKLAQALAAAGRETRNLDGCVELAQVACADVVVACINLDLVRPAGRADELAVPHQGYAAALRAIGQHLRSGAIVCIESTLPLGLSDRVLYPALCEGAALAGRDLARDPPLYAYCYERVMPGPGYLDSVNHFWRSYAGIDARSADRAQAFLSKYVDVERFPLWRHKTLRAAEAAKLLENAYRATNIAFIDEWTRLAEAAGIDLFDVVNSVRVRKGTHDNMMFPGLGVGGYCLTKDALLAAWGAEELLGIEAALPFSRQALLVNERMPLRARDWISEHFGGRLAERTVAIFGLTYRAGVADTRSSPSEVLARGLLERGARVRACDPLLTAWDECPAAQFLSDPRTALQGADALVVSLPDTHWKERLPALLRELATPPAIVVDPWNVLGDACYVELARRGVRVRVYGRGDIPEPARKP
jgi:nucleotide sugar dehydrogenase